MPAAMATRDEVCAALTRLCYLAKREMPAVGTTLHPTPWDLLHIRINVQLELWEIVVRGG